MHQFPAILTNCAAMVVAEVAAVRMSREDIGSFKNKAVYTASGAQKHVDKRRCYGPTDGWMDGQTDGWTNRTSYRGALEHLEIRV